MHEILHEAQGNGKRKYHVKWRDTIVLRTHIAMFEQEGYKTESQLPSADDEYISLTNREQWIVASWKPTYDPAHSTGDSEQIQQLLAETRAKLKPSQQELGPARRDIDLTDGRQIQGNCIDSSHRCAHLVLQEPHLRDLIKLDPMTRGQSRQRCAAPPAELKCAMPFKQRVPLNVRSLEACALRELRHSIRHSG